MGDKTEVAVRCPVGPQRLFLKMIVDGDHPKIVPGMNLMELACSDCARSYRKSGKEIFRVLHRYYVDGSLCETIVQYEDGTDKVIPE